MRIGELAERSGVTIKALRYYEELGLIEPAREPNGYRDYDESVVVVVCEIRDLHSWGIPPSKVRPFVDCLSAGHRHGDECVESLVAYRAAIRELDQAIDELSRRRAELRRRLEHSASRTIKIGNSSMVDFTQLPSDLPRPVDDGAARHLPGRAMPDLTLTTSDLLSINLGDLGPGRTIIYMYPLTGRPGQDLPAGWDEIPGARGCSTEACDFRDHFEDLRDLGVQRVFGMSSQDPAYQAEVVDRLSLPFTMISDERFALGAALSLPTFSAPPHERLYARLTLIINDDVIEHMFYPIFPPNEHARQVLSWLRDRTS